MKCFSGSVVVRTVADIPFRESPPRYLRSASTCQIGVKRSPYGQGTYLPAMARHVDKALGLYISLFCTGDFPRGPGGLLSR